MESSTGNIKSEPVPYEKGDHCLFYAVQEASRYFRKGGPTLEDRDRVTKIREKAEIGLGSETNKIAWLTKSIEIISEELQAKSIVIDRLNATPSSKKMLEQNEITSKYEINELLHMNENTLHFPVLIFTSRITNNEGHVWCCTSKTRYRRDIRQHIANGDRVVVIADISSKK